MYNYVCRSQTKCSVKLRIINVDDPCSPLAHVQVQTQTIRERNFILNEQIYQVMFTDFSPLPIMKDLFVITCTFSSSLLLLLLLLLLVVVVVVVVVVVE